jgi:hypothetical protein
MPRKRPREPIGPTTVPGEPIDPKIPPDQMPDERDEREAGEDTQPLRESEVALDRATTRIPPD